MGGCGVPGAGVVLSCLPGVGRLWVSSVAWWC